MKRDNDETSQSLERILAAPFLSNLTHELRTPLNSINGMTKLSLEACNQPELQEYLSILDESVDQLSSLLSLLIEYFNISTNSIIFHPREIDLEEFLLESIKHLFVVAKEKKLSFSLYIHPNVPSRFSVDPDRLKLVLEQLLGNAIKFTPIGGVSLDVQYSNDRKTLEFIVQDSGIGIDEEFLPRVFQAFQQENPDYTRHFGGIGLGFTIAHYLSRALGGQVEISSTKKQGTCVTVSLPLVPKETSTVLQDFREIPYTRWFVESDLQETHKFFRRFVEDLGPTFEYTDFRQRAREELPDNSVLFIETSLPLRKEVKDRMELGKTKIIRLDRLGGDVIPPNFPITPKRILQSLRISQPVDVEQRREKGSGLEGLRILIVEDDAINLLTVVRLLEKKGATVYQAGHVVKGLELLTKHHPDLALVDIGLPTISGFEFVRTVVHGNAKGIRPDFPVLALTAYSSQEDHTRMKKAGFREILVKPYNPQRLTETILRVIDENCGVSEELRGIRGHLESLIDTLDFRGFETAVSKELANHEPSSRSYAELFKLLLVSRREDIESCRKLLEKLESEGTL